jgi:hypothetical protein
MTRLGTLSCVARTSFSAMFGLDYVAGDSVICHNYVTSLPGLFEVTHTQPNGVCNHYIADGSNDEFIGARVCLFFYY